MEDSGASVPSAEGEVHVYLAASHILKALRASKTLPHDMRSILDDLDSRLSAMTVSIEVQDEGLSEIEERLTCAEKVIMDWVSNQSIVSDSGPEEVIGFIKAADEVQILVQKLKDSSFIRDRKWSKLHSHALNVLQTAMARLEETMIHMLVHNKQFIEPEYLSFRCNSKKVVSDELFVLDHSDAVEGPSERNDRTISTSLNGYTIDLVKPDAIPMLKSIAGIIVASNYEEEFRDSFIRTRKDALDEYLAFLHWEHTSIEELLSLDWSILSNRIKRWIWIIKLVIRVYFTSEKQLCDQILGHMGSLSSICFIQVTRASMINLITFGEAIALGPHQPEKLFRLLDMCEALEDLLPDVVALFSYESGASLAKEFHDLSRRLAESAKRTFDQFCTAIETYRSVTPFPRGGIHHLTRYVMNYMNILSDYGDILRLILGHQDGRDPDPLATHFQLVTAILDSNLITRSQSYKDKPLQHIFLMNNFHYIFDKSMKSKLRAVLGDECIRNFKVKLEQHARGYERCSWSSILSLLKADVNLCSNPLTKNTIKQRCRTFTSAFEQVYETQTGWLVPCPELRKELQASVSEKVVLAYRNFSGKGNGCIDKYIKYSDEDLENYLSDLFEGSPRCLSQYYRR